MVRDCGSRRVDSVYLSCFGTFAPRTRGTRFVLSTKVNTLQQLSLESQVAAAPPAPVAAQAPTVMASGGLDDRLVRQTVRHLAREHPQVPPEAIASLLNEALARTAGAKVQSFRLVLAERYIRNRLNPPDALNGQPPASAPEPIAT